MRLAYLILLVGLLFAAACSDDDYGRDMDGTNDAGAQTDGFDLAISTTD